MKTINKKTLFSAVAIFAVYGIVQGLIAFNALSLFYVLTLVQTCIYIMLAVSLNLIVGFTGQLALGHAGFMAIGAYISAIVTMKFDGPLVLALLAGALAAAVAGVIIGIPTLRLKGDYLAIATLGLGEIVRVIWLNTDYVGGAAGMSVSCSINWTWAFFLMVITVLVIRNFIRSSPGRACISVREDEIAAEAMGINSTKYKVIAFTMGSFFAGLAGGVYANYMYTILPTTFGFLKSFDILVMVVLGGLGSISGGVIGAIIMTIVSAALASFPEWRMVITAVLLIILMIFRPNGLLGNKELSLRVFQKKRGENNGLAKN